MGYLGKKALEINDKNDGNEWVLINFLHLKKMIIYYLKKLIVKEDDFLGKGRYFEVKKKQIDRKSFRWKRNLQKK